MTDKSETSSMVDDEISVHILDTGLRVVISTMKKEEFERLCD
jgi:hypothetical protein